MSYPYVTIIVPIFNAEHYLRECLESIMSQENQNWKLILINDGSTDRSREICKEFAIRDQRILYLEQENAGVSAARNLGIQHAEGEWMMFLDADDMISPQALNIIENTEEIMPDADMLIARYSFSKDDFSISQKTEIINGSEIQKSILNFRKYRTDHPDSITIDEYNRWSCWGRFYRTDFIRENNIRFSEGIRLGEDLLFCLAAAGKTERVGLNDSIVYYYRRNPYSVTGKFHSYRVENSLRVMQKAAEYVENRSLESCLNAFIIGTVTRCCTDYFADKRNGLNDADAAKQLEELCSKELINRAIFSCGYVGITVGKKRCMTVMFTLWCLRKRKYQFLLAALRRL